MFFVGGVTYEEAASVAQFNAQNPSMQVVLGSNTVHNSARCAPTTSSPVAAVSEYCEYL